MSKIWHLYIVEARDKSYYTGITTDIKRRLLEHNNKIGAKSLKGKLPVNLVHSETFNNQAEAAKRESEIKSWRKQKKVALINGL